MRICLAFLLLIAALGLRAETPLTPPPAGFSWQRLPEIKGALLKPDGWYFKKTKKRQTDVYAISKENVDKMGEFRTGVTLNRLPSITSKTGRPPSVFAAAFADGAALKYKLTERSSTKMGPFQALRFRYVDAPAPLESITVHKLLIANDKTGTLFLITFESPTAEWDEAWKTGEQILKKILLDDEV